jgi:hypothetical protein
MKAHLLILLLVVTVNSVVGQTDDNSNQLRKYDWEYFSVSKRLYLPVQFAGNIGFLSTGIGYRPLTDNYQLSLMYGFTPPFASAVRSHLITAKNVFHLYKFRLSDSRAVIPYAAVGISLEVKGHSFFTQPDIMSDSYYDFPKSIHAIPALGVKLRHRTLKFKGFEATEFYAELTSVDAYIWYKVTSHNVKLQQIISASIGVNFLLK